MMYVCSSCINKHGLKPEPFITTSDGVCELHGYLEGNWNFGAPVLQGVYGLHRILISGLTKKESRDEVLEQIRQIKAEE